MGEIEIVKEIKRLPLVKQFYVMEETIKCIKNEEMKHQLSIAAEALYDEYNNDKELTIFTSLDLQNFYEAR